MARLKFLRNGKQPPVNPATLESGLPATAVTEDKVLFNLDELGLEEEGFEADEALLNLDDSQEALLEVAEQTTYGEVFLDDLIKRQRALSISVAVVFLVIVLSLPLISFTAPSILNVQLLGFEISWLVLGILIYPVIWALAFYFVSTADKYEEEFTKMVK